MNRHPGADTPTPRVGWVEPDDPEWAHAWSHFPEPILEHPESGACLAYMGSTQAPGCGWAHVFRHHQVPGSPQRQYWRLSVSTGWVSEQPPQT